MTTEDIRTEAAATGPNETRTLAAWVRRDRGRATHWCPVVQGAGGAVIVTLQQIEWVLIPKSIDDARAAVLEQRAKNLTGVSALPSWRVIGDIEDKVRAALG